MLRAHGPGWGEAHLRGRCLSSSLWGYGQRGWSSQECDPWPPCRSHQASAWAHRQIRAFVALSRPRKLYFSQTPRWSLLTLRGLLIQDNRFGIFSQFFEKSHFVNCPFERHGLNTCVSVRRPRGNISPPHTLATPCLHTVVANWWVQGEVGPH